MTERFSGAGLACAIRFLCFAAVGFFGAQLCRADEDPSALWYRAFLTFESANDLEQQGQYPEALNKCNEAKALYDGLAYKYPQFQPKIVKYKQQVLADARLRIKDLMSRYGSSNPKPVPAPSSSIRRPSPTGTSQIPHSPEFPNVEAPTSSGPPQIGTTRHPSQVQIESEYIGPSGSNVLPSWDAQPSVGRISTELLDEARRNERRIELLNEENDRLMRERDSYKSRFERTQQDLLEEQMKVANLKKQKEALERDPTNQDATRRAQAYKKLLDEAISDLNRMTELNTKLANQLRAARAKIKVQGEQIAKLEAERENLLGIIQGKGLGSERLQDLIKRNQELAQKLDNAEKLAASVANINRQKDADIAMLKSQIAKVKTERDKLVEENASHQAQIETLHRKLEMLSDGLSREEKDSLAKISPEQRAENELLRSMVLKQLRRQAQLKQAKELLLRQLDRVGARSSVLMEVVEDMARGPQLSPEEKKLFRAPQFAELLEDDGDSSGAFSLIAPGNGKGRQEINGQKIEVELSQIDKAARLDFQEKRYAEAEAGFLKYLHYRPRSVPCLCNLGVLKLAIKNYTEAEHYLQKAIAIDNHSGLAYYLLGRTCLLQNKFDEALSNLEQSLQIDPRNAKAHNCVGVISSQKGWVTRAEKAFNKAVDLQPDFGDAHFNLAVLFSTRDQPNSRKAEEHYFKALNLGIPRDAAIEDFLKNAATMNVGLR